MATQPISGFGDTAAELASAVGLDPDRTRAFTIEVDPEKMVTVRSDQYTTADAIESVTRIFAAARGEWRGPLREGSERLIPPGRLADLTSRALVGALTNAEKLALAVLAGGNDGELAMGRLIDAATEEFAHGCYRVPVRVVADRKRLKLILTPPSALTPMGAEHIGEAVRAWVESDVERQVGRGQSVMILPGPGWTVQAFEVGDGTEVEVAEGPLA